MKLLLLLATSSWALAGAPTDAELLQFIRSRSSLERVTPALVDMAPVVAVRCISDPLAAANPHEKAKFYTFANAPAVLPMFDPWGEISGGKFAGEGKIRQ
jgi:hypothetical protein